MPCGATSLFIKLAWCKSKPEEMEERKKKEWRRRKGVRGGGWKRKKKGEKIRSTRRKRKQRGKGRRKVELWRPFPQYLRNTQRIPLTSACPIPYPDLQLDTGSPLHQHSSVICFFSAVRNLHSKLQDNGARAQPDTKEHLENRSLIGYYMIWGENLLRDRCPERMNFGLECIA